MFIEVRNQISLRGKKMPRMRGGVGDMHTSSVPHSNAVLNDTLQAGPHAHISVVSRAPNLHWMQPKACMLVPAIPTALARIPAAH